MMKYVVMSVRDRAIDSFGQPFYVAAIGQAIRSFSDAINSDKEDNICKHPDDFDLYHLGYFNDDGSGFELLDNPRLVSVGKDVLRPKG